MNVEPAAAVIVLALIVGIGTALTPLMAALALILVAPIGILAGFFGVGSGD